MGRGAEKEVVREEVGKRGDGERAREGSGERGGKWGCGGKDGEGEVKKGEGEIARSEE